MSYQLSPEQLRESFKLEIEEAEAQIRHHRPWVFIFGAFAWYSAYRCHGTEGWEFTLFLTASILAFLVSVGAAAMMGKYDMKKQMRMENIQFMDENPGSAEKTINEINRRFGVVGDSSGERRTPFTGDPSNN